MESGKSEKKFCTRCFVAAILGLLFIGGTVVWFFSSFEGRVQDVREQNEFKQPQPKGDQCSDYQCLELYYQELTRTEGIEAAFADLKVSYEKSPQVRALCHPVTHVIGRTATETLKKVGEAFSQGDPFCWSGYFHGVMEGMLRDTAPQELPAFINTICEGIPGKESYSFDYYNCVHGLGHGVMYITGNELFNALFLCDELEGAWEKESCYGGVFMENVITDFENHFTVYLKPAEPLYPCTAVQEQYKRACYLMQTSYLLKVNGYNFADAFEQCSTIEEQYEDTCYQSVGRDASGSTLSDIQRTRTSCMLGKNERQQTQCAVGAVKDFISYFHSDVQAKQLCDSFEGNVRETCHSVAILYYRSFHNFYEEPQQGRQSKG